MSSKYNRFLLSACLPVMAVTIFVSTPAFAGFEWTPPEEAQPAPLPIETLEPVAPEAVMSEPLPEIDVSQPEEISEPAITIKVLDDAETDAQVDEAIENAVEVNETNINVMPEDMPDETITIELKDEIELIEASTEETPEVSETVDVEIMAEIPSAETNTDTASQDPALLSINPYPIKEGDTDTAEAQTPVVLPSDTDKELADITAEDVNITATEVEVDTKSAAQETILWNETETFDVIEGFGTDMPLALALRQIVPAQYAFSFGKDINPGTAISWSGGQPWNSVLEAALAPLNISFELEGKKILLRSVEAAPAPTVEVVEETAPAEEASISTEDSPESIIDEVITTESAEDTAATEIVETIIIGSTGPNHAQSAEIATPAQELETKSLQDVVEETTEKNSDAPLDIIEIKEDAVEPKVIAEAKDAAKDVSIKRNNIQDPGKMETEQPITIEQPEAAKLLEEKKNEVTSSEAQTSPTDLSAEGGVNYTEAALKQISEENIAALGAATETPEPIENIIADEQTADTGIDATNAPAPIIAQNIAALDAPVILEQTNEAKLTDAITLDEITPAEANAEDALTESSFRTMPSNTIKIWEANRKANLRRTLDKWSETENIELIWDSSENYALDKDVFISGTFENAIDILFSKGLKNPPKYVLVKNPSYNLHISEE